MFAGAFLERRTFLAPNILIHFVGITRRSWPCPLASPWSSVTTMRWWIVGDKPMSSCCSLTSPGALSENWVFPKDFETSNLPVIPIQVFPHFPEERELFPLGNACRGLHARIVSSAFDQSQGWGIRMLFAFAKPVGLSPKWWPTNKIRLACRFQTLVCVINVWNPSPICFFFFFVKILFLSYPKSFQHIWATWPHTTKNTCSKRKLYLKMTRPLII